MAKTHIMIMSVDLQNYMKSTHKVLTVTHATADVSRQNHTTFNSEMLAKTCGIYMRRYNMRHSLMNTTKHSDHAER